jgi:Phage integrase, N-terminal SAM-like domain
MSSSGPLTAKPASGERSGNSSAHTSLRTGRRVRLARRTPTTAPAESRVLLKQSGGVWPPQEPKPTEQPLTAETYSAQWLDRHDGKVSERVIENYRRSFRVHLNPRLGSLGLDEVRRRHVNELVAALVDAGMARKSIRNNLAPYAECFGTHSTMNS